MYLNLHVLVQQTNHQQILKKKTKKTTVRMCESLTSAIKLVGFYGISTIVDYLKPIPLYTYILNMICKYFVDNIFK